MITGDLLLPSLYHLQRSGIVSQIDICALGTPPLKALKDNRDFHEAFPGQDFTPHPSLSENPAKRFPALYQEVIAAMAQQKVIVGRAWPSMPTYTRITIGTREEMGRFQVAFQKVMSGTAVGWVLPNEEPKLRHMDGFVLPG